MKYISNIFTYHIRSIAIGIILIGAMVSFGIIYYAFSSPAVPVASVGVAGENISAAGDRFDRVFLWFAEKEKATQSVPVIPNSAFFIPSGL